MDKVYEEINKRYVSGFWDWLSQMKDLRAQVDVAEADMERAMLAEEESTIMFDRYKNLILRLLGEYSLVIDRASKEAAIQKIRSRLGSTK